MTEHQPLLPHSSYEPAWLLDTQVQWSPESVSCAAPTPGAEQPAARAHPPLLACCVSHYRVELLRDDNLMRTITVAHHPHPPLYDKAQASSL